ncbi:MAG: CDP-diacylglycerol--glycerol-3-phosphate 3-phosphatidyltransferase [Acidobacteriota bacterium]
MNLPNSLTLIRIFLVPVLVVVLLTGVADWQVWGVILVLLAAFTDWLDGYLARRRKQVTTLGKLLDPIADKLLISAAFISLVEIRIVPAWMVVLIIGREFAVSGLRNIASSEGYTISASTLGKSKMAAQVIAISLLIVGANMESHGWIRNLGTMALWAVVAFSIVSMCEYFWKFWNQIDERIKYRERRRIDLLHRRRNKGNASTH